MIHQNYLHNTKYLLVFSEKGYGLWGIGDIWVMTWKSISKPDETMFYHTSQYIVHKVQKAHIFSDPQCITISEHLIMVKSY